MEEGESVKQKRGEKRIEGRKRMRRSRTRMERKERKKRKQGRIHGYPSGVWVGRGCI